MADAYAAKRGFKLNHNIPAAKANPEFASKIADAYEKMPHTPNHPETQKAYQALIHETTEQLNHLHQHGYKFSKIQPGQENPYKNSKDLIQDLHENKHAWYYPTESGFGNEGSSGGDHPLLQHVKTASGESMPANDAFRIVHDVFGHAKEGHGFGPHGEENAWQHHMQMYSPEAQKALTSETRGQNSWVNFGPHGETNRKNPAQTIYAEQKAGIMPDWTRQVPHGPKTVAPADPQKKSLQKSEQVLLRVLAKSIYEAKFLRKSYNYVSVTPPERLSKSEGQQVAAIAVISGNKLLMGKRRDNGRWTNPGGHLEAGEKPLDGAKRELFEEAGIKAPASAFKYLGSENVTTYTGKKKLIHAFAIHGNFKTTSKNDPDKEVAQWEYVDCSNGVPEDVATNLHSPKNVLLKKLKLL